MVAATHFAGERGHGDAAPRSLPPFRPKTRQRARGTRAHDGHRTLGRHGAAAKRAAGAGASARLFCRSRRHRRKISGAARRPAGRRAGARRLGYPFQRGHRQRPAVAIARRARRSAGRGRDQYGTGLARYRRRAGHRVRPHRAHQRHRRHRPRHRDGRASGRRRAQRRPSDRRLAGAEEQPISTRTAISNRPPICAPCSRAF